MKQKSRDKLSTGCNKRNFPSLRSIHSLLDHFPSIFITFSVTVLPPHTEQFTIDLLCQKFENYLGKQSVLHFGQGAILFVIPCKLLVSVKQFYTKLEILAFKKET